MNLKQTVISTIKSETQPVFSGRGYRGQVWAGRNNEGLDKNIGVRV